MATEEAVVVVVRPKTLHHDGKDIYATRIRQLGLTAYGDTHEESLQKVKKMFVAFVKAHRKRGTLEERLGKSGLEWCWEREYKGKLPVEWVSSKDNGKKILSCDKTEDQSWKVMGELAVA